jgi:hypothetical protein
MTTKRLRIGVMGMPRTGKTDFALALAKRLWLDDKGRNAPEWEVIDDYAQDMAKDLKLDIGPNSSYIPNLMIALKRIEREQAAKIAGKHYITVGTDVDTIAYMAVQLELIAQQPKTDLRDKLGLRMSQGAITLSMMMEDLFDYDYIFQMPIPERFKIVVPGDVTSVETYPQQLVWVDEALRTACIKWGLDPGKLTGTVDEQVDQALGIIGRLTEAKEV